MGVGIAAGNSKNALRQQLFDLVLDLAELPLVDQARGQYLRQLEPPVGSFQQNSTAIGIALPREHLHDVRVHAPCILRL